MFPEAYLDYSQFAQLDQDMSFGLTNNKTLSSSPIKFNRNGSSLLSEKAKTALQLNFKQSVV